jgi:hypothetical protein
VRFDADIAVDSNSVTDADSVTDAGARARTIVTCRHASHRPRN